MNILVYKPFTTKDKMHGHVLALSPIQPVGADMRGDVFDGGMGRLVNVDACNGQSYSIGAAILIVIPKAQITDVPCVKCRRLIKDRYND